MTDITFTRRSALTVIQTGIATLALVAGTSHAADWSSTEVIYKYGRLDAPRFAGGGAADTNILTLQHASGWGFGDVFLFIDSLHDNRRDGFNDNDLYGEMYVNFSASKLSGKQIGAGPIKDIGLLAGVNAGANAKVRKYLPGVRLSWDAPGFTFLNSDLTLYLDDNAGVARGGAPRESNSHMLDINWSRPFEVGSQAFDFSGHMEYIGSRSNEFGAPIGHWILAQPTLRWDAGKAWYDKPGQLHLGLAWQYWQNKLSDGSTQESRAQLLAAWRF